MDVPLKGLLGETQRSIIVCGKLLCQDRELVTVSKENFKETFHVLNRKDKNSNTNRGAVRVDVDVETGERWITSRIEEFEKKYSPVLNGVISKDEVSAYAYEDVFINSIVIETDTYRQLVRPELHDTKMQLSRNQQQLVREFAAEYVAWYYDVFYYLFSRRLTAQRVDMVTRSHLVQGLFQPWIVASSGVISPLALGENKWLYDALAPYEVWLEYCKGGTGTRHVDLSCVAFSHIAEFFNVPVVKMMDRRDFMFMVMLCLLSQLDKDKGVELSKQYGYIFRKIASREDYIVLFTAMKKFSDNAHLALKVV